MYDHGLSLDGSGFARAGDLPRPARPGSLFPPCKRAFDLGVSALLLLPLLAGFALLLLALNPVCNRGPLFFVQTRMGRNCRPFRAIKFRTMRAGGGGARAADDPLETHRITGLGRLLRRSRIDELPQVLNVLGGQMSLIGPRPDVYDHALHFLAAVPGYRDRHAVRPGISGLAQVEIGYVEGTEATRAKVAADLRYIADSGFRLEFQVIRRTVSVILRCAGA